MYVMDIISGCGPHMYVCYGHYQWVWPSFMYVRDTNSGIGPHMYDMNTICGSSTHMYVWTLWVNVVLICLLHHGWLLYPWWQIFSSPWLNAVFLMANVFFTIAAVSLMANVFFTMAICLDAKCLVHHGRLLCPWCQMCSSPWLAAVSLIANVFFTIAGCYVLDGKCFFHHGWLLCPWWQCLLHHGRLLCPWWQMSSSQWLAVVSLMINIFFVWPGC